MNMKRKELTRVSIELSARGFKEQIKTFYVDETAKKYAGTRHVVDKGAIGKVLKSPGDTCKSLTRYAFCLNQDEVNGLLDLIKEDLRVTVEKMGSDLSGLSAHFIVY